MQQKILVFPGGNPKSIDFMQQMAANGVSIIGASSLDHDPVKVQYPAWANLPYVNNPDFMSELEALIECENIGGIFTPNLVVWDYLNKNLDKTSNKVRLVNANPVDEQTRDYTTALKWAAQIIENDTNISLSASKSKPIATELQLASLFHYAETIPGMCDRDKLRAMCAISRETIRGDIVEIGSWWGKSAFILAQLSAIYDIGNILCVDPWSSSHIVQHDGDSMVDDIDLDTDFAFNIFKINMSILNPATLNYLRMPSVDAGIKYNQSDTITSPEFGETIYQGEISILHIDGNHNLENVSADIKSWCKFVTRGGWIIIDDYIWPYGDGPKIAGDEYINDNWDRINCAFVTGSALFIQLA